jgi:hypothetical protein
MAASAKYLIRRPASKAVSAKAPVTKKALRAAASSRAQAETLLKAVRARSKKLTADIDALLSRLG